MPFSSQPAPPAPPAAPAPVPSVTVDGTNIQIGPPARPLTSADVSALRAKRSELGRQISSVEDRRNDVMRQLQRAPESAKSGLEQRLAILDARMVQLEQDIAANGRELAQAPLDMVPETRDNPAERFGPFSSGQLTGISIVFTIAVLMPMALAAARMMFKRANQPKPSPMVLESAERLERMEQNLDALSIEIERISEGQRFVTQLMAKRDEVKVLRDATEPS